MSETLYSRPFEPKACCEACVFGGPNHAPWCAKHRDLDKENVVMLKRLIKLTKALKDAQRAK
jgi:hypothetical protein